MVYVDMLKCYSDSSCYNEQRQFAETVSLAEPCYRVLGYRIGDLFIVGEHIYRRHVVSRQMQFNSWS